MVVLKQAAEPFTAWDAASNGANIISGLDQLITQTLVVLLGVVVLDVLTRRPFTSTPGPVIL